MLNLELRLNNEAVAKLEINSSLISRLFHAVVSPATESAEPAAPASHAKHGPLSSPLTKAQAEELLAEVDKASAEFLKRVAANHGALTWGETKALFDLRDWEGILLGAGTDDPAHGAPHHARQGRPPRLADRARMGGAGERGGRGLPPAHRRRRLAGAARGDRTRLSERRQPEESAASSTRKSRSALILGVSASAGRQRK